jgi:dihydrofolate synthase/folylpolyglutamate synthase
MNYSETLAYLYSRLPMFQRIGAAAYKANLDNTIAIDQLLQHPHKKFKSIHIAGTNGKGSVSHLLASIFQESGYKTGLYTSPHLIDFRERIKINGKEVDKEFVVEFVDRYKSEFEKIEPSFFEWTVGLAFDYFAQNEVDIAIIETGMGGRLDSTNIIQPLISVITNISFDHKQFLGDTLDKIAAEKAGIIKPNIPVIIGETQQETNSVFDRFAIKNKSEIIYADQVFNCKKTTQSDKLIVDITKNKDEYIHHLSCGLVGNYQLLNIATVLTAIDKVTDLFPRINLQNIRKGIDNVIENTDLKGRWQLIEHNPKVVCDTAHNVAGIKMITQQLIELKPKKIHFILGFVNDKDVSEILELLPKEACYYFCEPSIPRAMKIENLIEIVGHRFTEKQFYLSVQEAYVAAKNNCLEEELIYIGGSTFVVADFLSTYEKK